MGRCSPLPGLLYPGSWLHRPDLYSTIETVNGSYRPWTASAGPIIGVRRAMEAVSVA